MEEGFLDRRVVVTGLGLVTPLGVGVKETWAALCAGKSGIGEITKFDASKHETKIAAEVKGFDAKDFLPKKEVKRTQDFIAYAVAAARMALEDADFTIQEEVYYSIWSTLLWVCVPWLKVPGCPPAAISSPWSTVRTGSLCRILKRSS